jgi:hypothetical protein
MNNILHHSWSIKSFYVFTFFTCPKKKTFLLVSKKLLFENFKWMCAKDTLNVLSTYLTSEEFLSLFEFFDGFPSVFLLLLIWFVSLQKSSFFIFYLQIISISSAFSFALLLNWKKSVDRKIKKICYVRKLTSALIKIKQLTDRQKSN